MRKGWDADGTQEMRSNVHPGILPRTVGRHGAPPGHSGFTVVEIIVALTILALILIPLFGGFSWSLGHTSLANQQTTATNIARERLEMARVAASTPAGFAGLQTGGEARAPVSGASFEREMLINFYSSINIIIVTVNVYANSTDVAPVVSLASVVSQ